MKCSATLDGDDWISTKDASPEVGREIEILVGGYYPRDQYLIRRGQMMMQDLGGLPTRSFHEVTIWKGKPSLCLVNAEFWRYLTTEPIPDLPWTSGSNIAGVEEYDSWLSARP